MEEVDSRDMNVISLCQLLETGSLEITAQCDPWGWKLAFTIPPKFQCLDKAHRRAPSEHPLYLSLSSRARTSRYLNEWWYRQD